MLRLFRMMLILSTAFFLTACSGLTGLLFYPQSQYLRTPADVELEYEQVSFKANDGIELSSWFLPAKKTTALLEKQNDNNSPIVLFLHGNAENISTHIGSVYWLPERGVDVFLLDYRGFGHSKGSPFIPAVLQDVEASLLWLRQRFPERPIYILGQSIGAAIATTSMALFEEEYAVNGLILDASLTGYRDIAQHVISQSFITWPVWPLTWLLPTQWDPIDHIDKISAKPLLMFHSQGDAVLPYDDGYRLFEKAVEPKQWYDSKGGHIQTFNYSEYREILIDFLAM